jgi:hypothetical protein
MQLDIRCNKVEKIVCMSNGAVEITLHDRASHFWHGEGMQKRSSWR